jgi:putative peptidoglycan lipid II flippase
MLGVALGVVLMPRLSAAKAKNQTQDYSAMLDWGLRLVVVLAVPCAVALLLFALPLAATIFHYGAYKAADVLQTSYALQTYGVGLLGLVAVKVLAPGFYAGKDIKTPVKIAVVVLIITQLLNLVLVPLFQHAGLALSIAIGALINALWLLVGLIKKGLYQPQKGWWKLLLQVSLASAALAGVLFYASQHWAWIDPESSKLLRVAVMAIVLMACALLYPACLWLTGVKIKNLLRPVAILNK